MHVWQLRCLAGVCKGRPRLDQPSAAQKATWACTPSHNTGLLRVPFETWQCKAEEGIFYRPDDQSCSVKYSTRSGCITTTGTSALLQNCIWQWTRASRGYQNLKQRSPLLAYNLAEIASTKISQIRIRPALRGYIQLHIKSRAATLTATRSRPPRWPPYIFGSRAKATCTVQPPPPPCLNKLRQGQCRRQTA